MAPEFQISATPLRPALKNSEDDATPPPLVPLCVEPASIPIDRRHAGELAWPSVPRWLTIAGMTETPPTQPQSPEVWLPPTEACWDLPAGEVHLWRATLDVSATQLTALSATLGDDEPERAARRIFERDRNHFVAARGTLRMLLGRYLQREPASLSFEYGSHGKPSLRAAPNAATTTIEFNVAHSHGLALIALARDRTVGVDLERVRGEVRCDALAGRCYSPAELRYYESLSDDLRRQHFFAAWARKESLLKATGRGLSLAMRDVEVADSSGSAAGILKLADTSGVPKNWRWQAVEPGDGYTGAIAAEDGPWQLHRWQWPDA